MRRAATFVHSREAAQKVQVSVPRAAMRSVKPLNLAQLLQRHAARAVLPPVVASARTLVRAAAGLRLRLRSHHLQQPHQTAVQVQRRGVRGERGHKQRGLGLALRSLLLR
jgi:hypothetical protein